MTKTSTNCTFTIKSLSLSLTHTGTHTHAGSCSSLYPWQLGGLSSFRQRWRGASVCPPLPPPSSSSSLPLPSFRHQCTVCSFLLTVHQFRSPACTASIPVWVCVFALYFSRRVWQISRDTHPLMNYDGLDMSSICLCELWESCDRVDG